MAGKDDVINIFPNLAHDAKFAITSPIDVNYNCIAWAFGLYKDRWMQPFPQGIQLDGVFYWWPKGVAKELTVEAYIKAFGTKGYEICDNFDLEDGILKVALYENIQDGQYICSHAARQKLCGTWMSKLGQAYDIEHDTPYSVEGDVYGRVCCFLKINRY